MNETQVSCTFFNDGQVSNRRKLFKEALLQAKTGKVLYIMQEELKELPNLSHETNVLNHHYLKMITFLYIPNIEALIDSISTLPDWQKVPSTIILEDLGEYCDINEKHNACGVVAFLLDAAHSCAKNLNKDCKLYISMNKDIVGSDYCNLLMDLYGENKVNK